MSHETRHIATVQQRAGQFRDPLAAAAKAYAVAHNRLLEAADIVTAFQAAAGLILAAEALGDLVAASHKTLREVLAQEMAEVGAHAIETEHHTVSYASAPAKVVITDERAVPERFRAERISVVTDLHAIAKAAKSGEAVPGVQIIDNRAPVLRISRRKA